MNIGRKSYNDLNLKDNLLIKKCAMKRKALFNHILVFTFTLFLTSYPHAVGKSF